MCIKIKKTIEADDEYKKAFEGKVIIKMEFTTDVVRSSYDGKEYDSTVEGGLTFILEDKDGNRSIVVLGYTELGEWIEFQQELF